MKNGRTDYVKATHMSEPVWVPEGELRFLLYRSYEQYLEHQAAKLRTLDLADYSAKFKQALNERIDRIKPILLGTTVLCLGARNGAECEAFISRGFFAIGIDVNPGEQNKFVVKGDFHNIQYAAGSVDVVFTNTLDHVLDFDKAIHEIRRVLKPGGTLIAEIVRGSLDEHGREPGLYESAWWDHVDSVTAQIERRGFDLKNRTFFDYPWNGDQFVYVKVS